MCLELGSKKQTQQHRAIPYSAKCNPMIINTNVGNAAPAPNGVHAGIREQTYPNVKLLRRCILKMCCPTTPNPLLLMSKQSPPKKTPMNPRCQPRTYVGHPAGLACFTNFTYQLRPSHILNSIGPQQSTMCKTVATYPSQSLLILGLGGGLTYTKSTYALYFACNSELNMPFSQCAL